MSDTHLPARTRRTLAQSLGTCALAVGRTVDGAGVGRGSLASMTDAADARATGLCSFAILAGLLTLAPMAASYLVGLLG